jgi:hypothetical protein
MNPQGLWQLLIHTNTWPSQGLRGKWSAAKVQRVEKLIPDFIAGLMRTAAVLRRQEEERTRRALEQKKAGARAGGIT